MRTGTNDGLQVDIAFEVDAAGEAAFYESEIRRGDVLVSSHKVRVALGGQAETE